MQPSSKPSKQATAIAGGRRWLRRVLRLLTVIVAVIAGGALLLASHWGKSLVLRSAAAVVRTRLGVEAQAAGFDYRITARGVTLHGVRATHPGATQPFFTADRVDVDVLPAVVLGTLALQRLEVAKAEIVIGPSTWAASGTSRAGASPTTLPAFDIRHVDVRDLAVTVVTSPDTQVSVQGLSVALDGDGIGRLRGEVRASGGLSVQHPKGNVRFDRMRADVALSSTSLSLTSITTDSPVAAVGATVRLDISRGDLDATGHARIDAGQLRQWWSDAPRLDGTLEIAGAIRGPLDTLVATLTARGERLQWKTVTDGALAASLHWSGGDLVIDSYDVWSKPGGLRLRGWARVGTAGATRASALHVEARADDPSTLALPPGTPAVRAPLTLLADLTWPGGVPSSAAIEGRLKMTALDPDPGREPIAILEAEGRGGRWIGRQRVTLPGDTSVTADMSLSVDAVALSRSRLDGRLVMHSADASAALRGLGRLGLATKDVERAFAGGRVTADATLAGTLASPLIDARANAESLTIGGIDQVRAETQLRVQDGSLSIARMTVESPGNCLDVSGAAALGAGPLDLTVDARFERPEALAIWLPAQWRPSGTLVFSGRVAGSSREPTFAARVSGSGLQANGILVDTLETGLTFERGVLRVTDLRLRRADGSLRLDGDIDRRLTHMNLRGRGEHLALSLRELEGAGPLRADDLSVEIDVAGPPRQPAGHLSATAGAVTVNGRALGPATLAAQSTGASVKADFALPSHRAGVTGAIGLQHGFPFDARATLDKSQIAPLLAMVGGPDAPAEGAGVVSASAVVAGRLDRPFESSGVLTIAELDGQVRGRPLTLVEPGRIRFDGRRVTVEKPLRMTLGGFAIGVAPSAVDGNGDAVVATLDGRIEEGLALLRSNSSSPPWNVEGPVRARVSIGHDGDRLAISGDADAALDRIVRDGEELARGVRIRAHAGRGAIEVVEAAGTVLGGPFSATGHVPIDWILPAAVARTMAGGAAPPLEAAVSARADVAFARALSGPGGTKDQVAGTATIAIEGRAKAPRLEDVDATMNVDASELAIDEVRLIQQAPARLRLNRGRLEVTALALKGPRSELTASGAIGLAAGAEGELRVDGTAALSLLRGVTPGTGGDAAFQLRVSGPPGARQTSAAVDLKDVSLIEPERQLALAGLSGRLTLDGDVLEAHGLRGQLNGGELTIDGMVPIRAGVAASRPLKVEGRGLFVEIPRGLRSQLDARIAWENASGGPRLSGQVSIASDTYREPITALASLASSLSNVSPAGARTLPAWMAATGLDVRLTSVGPLVVDQSVLRLEMVPDLRLTGTIGRPALSGQVAIQDDGRVQAGGRTYRVTDSRLEFSPAAGLLPRLNVIGETRVSSYQVTLRMTGPANEIETNFSSDPPLSERDVRSLLVTGQTADPSRRSSESDRFAIGAVSGDVLGVAGQFVGLDSVRVGSEDLDLVSSDVNPATRLTVSKRLGSRFELVLSENLEESQSTWIIIYRPVSGYEFRLSSEENTTQALEFRQEVTFGPGVSPHARVQTVAVVADRVHSVTLDGDPGFPADQVLAGTKIRAGDRFDFRRWLDDRDQIARFYRDRGYLGARIVPMRTTGEGAGKERPVDLQYRITRGQRTLLEVNGYPAGDPLMERLRRTWSETVLIDLLNDSLARAARDYLVEEGFLRAGVKVRLDHPEPDTVRARVEIEPGPHTSSRHFAFSGNQVIPSEVLQDLAAASRVDEDPWKNPGPLLAAIQAAYAAKGHLAARATAGTIEFSNGTATLPIHVEEGVPARVASVELTGVAAERRSGALAAVALPVGSPFASAMGRAGRTRLERYYRDLGYRDVRVDVTGTAAPQASDVSLRYGVREGPLHVVRSVEISGVESTRASLVNDAIGLAPGQPAGAAAATATEKRLYDLGTFRRAELRFEPDPAGADVAGTLPVKAIVSLEEARRFQLRYGVELSSEYNSALSQRREALGVAADLRDRNFLGRGMSLGGGLRYEPDLKSARGLFSVPKLSGRPIRTNVYLTGRGEEDATDQQVTVRDDEVELALEQRWRVGRAFEYSWGYSADWRDTQLAAATRDDSLAFSGTLASVNGAAVVDRRDSFFDAKRGWFGSASLQWGERAFGSDFDYLRTLVRGSYYQPLGRMVLAGNLEWGRLRPLGGVPPLTVFDLFFNAGGTESVRGYAQDELTGYSFLGAPLGGTTLLVGNAELRSPLFWRLGGVLFADAGNTFADHQAVRFHDLAVGLGFGLRINTPLAPIRIDLGFPRRPGESGARWHFSIGQMF